MDDEVLRIEIRHADGITLLTVAGEIDADSMLALQTPLDELALDGHTVLDMSGVRFMDSTGLNVILTQRLRMHEADGSIHIRNPSPAVRRLIQISGLADYLYEPTTPGTATREPSRDDRPVDGDGIAR